MSFGKNLEKELKRQGKTVYSLSSATKIPKSTIYSIIKNTNENGYPRMDTMKKIADYLNVSIYELQGVPFVEKAFEKQRDREERKLLSYFNKLSATEKTYCLEIVKNIAKIKEYNNLLKTRQNEK